MTAGRGDKIEEYDRKGNKKVLRKWLKKKLYNDNLPLSSNIARFEWVYNSPLKEWRDRIWIATNCHQKAFEEEGLNRHLEEYLYR